MSDARQVPPKLAFLHVPKCGGVSVESELKKHYAAPEVAPFYFPHEYDSIKRAEQLQSYSLVIGHFDHDVIDRLGPEVIRAVLFRDPVSRVVSLYNHAASRPKHALHETIRRGELQFRKFCNVGGARNTLSRYLLGRSNFARLSRLRPRSKAIQSVVDLAKANLRHFDCVGMIYDMERFNRLLSRRTGLKLESFKRSNSSPARMSVSTMTADELSACEAANVFDLEVYGAIRDGYERSCRVEAGTDAG